MSWAKLFDRCIDCGRDTVKHKAYGRCVTCHRKFRYKTDPVFRAKKKAIGKRWWLNHYETELEKAHRWQKNNKERRQEVSRTASQRRRRTVFVELAGTMFQGYVEAWGHLDGERVADVRMPSGNLLTLPRSGLIRYGDPRWFDMREIVGCR